MIENIIYFISAKVMIFSALTSFYAKRFKMTEIQAVAIMGAHTLGQAHLGNSGFKVKFINQLS